MINDRQAKVLNREYGKCGNITMSSLKAGMHRDTGSKYIKAGKLPSEIKRQRHWRTHDDEFAFVEDDIKELLREPKVNAKTILISLQGKYPGRFKDGMLRTLQRKVKDLKIDMKKERDVVFSQEHYPGKRMMLDWTFCTELNITVNGEQFDHKLCHAVLAYSGWECATICYSESMLSLKHGFQEAVFRLGKVPLILQTDHSSTATHQVMRGSKERAFNDNYLSFMEHFDVEPHTINVGKANENGTVESANGHLKNRINQALILRGSREFFTVDEYRNFLESVLVAANAPRQEDLKEELKYMNDAPPIRLPEYNEERHRVSRQSFVRLMKVTYSMPSQYIGEELRFRIYEDRIDVWHKSKYLFEVKRVHGDRGASINYRHIIGSLRRKPGAFSEWKYHTHMFPSMTFRRLYDALKTRYDNRRADREYLDILYLASQEGEKQVEPHLQDMLAYGAKNIGLDPLKELMKITPPIHEVEELEPQLSEYDQFIGGNT